MFHGGDNDLITFLDKLPPIRRSYQIDAFSGPLSKNYFFPFSSVNKLLSPGSGFFKGIGGPFCQSMNAPVNIGVLVVIIII